MSKRVAVKFLKSWRGYSAKEVAGFSLAEAQTLVDGGAAEFVDKAKAKAAQKAAEKAAADAAGNSAPEGGQAGGDQQTAGAGGGNDNDGKP